MLPLTPETATPILISATTAAAIIAGAIIAAFPESSWIVFLVILAMLLAIGLPAYLTLKARLMLAEVDELLKRHASLRVRLERQVRHRNSLSAQIAPTVRPFIFTNLDERSQFLAGQLSANLDAAQKLVPGIDRKSQFLAGMATLPTSRVFFGLSVPILKYSIGLKRETGDYQRLVAQNDECLKFIKGTLQAIQDKSHVLRQQPARLVTQIEAAYRRMDELSIFGPSAVEKARLILSNAAQAADDAVSFRDSPQPQDNRGLNEARIYLNSVLGARFLSLFQLNLACHQLEGYHFKLNETARLLTTAENNLCHLLSENLQVGWLQLSKVEEALKDCEVILDHARSSLKGFEEQRNRMEGLSNEWLTSHKVETLFILAQDVERRCAGHFGTPAEFREEWQALLDGHERPSQALQKAQTFIDSHLAPALNHGLVRQTSLPHLINALEQLQSQLMAVEESIGHLKAALDRHEADEERCNAMLNPDGSTSREIDDLSALLAGANEDIQAQAAHLQADFEEFQRRASRRKQANFPSLLQELVRFETRCQELRQEHGRRLNEARGRAEKLQRNLATLYRRLADTHRRLPQPDMPWEALAAGFYDLSRKYGESGENIKLLEAHNCQAEQSQAEMQVELQQALDQVKDFNNRLGQTRSWLGEVEKHLRALQPDLSSGYAQNWSVSQLVFQALTQVRLVRQKLSETAKEKTIPAATAACKAIERDATTLLQQTDEEASRAIAQVERLNRLAESVNTAWQGALQLPPAPTDSTELKQVRSLFNAALKAANFSEAQSMLKMAAASSAANQASYYAERSKLYAK